MQRQLALSHDVLPAVWVTEDESALLAAARDTGAAGRYQFVSVVPGLLPAAQSNLVSW